ncbi:50S ribosomal protein L19e [Candidatus Woesearchaeota archaeon]|nr:50S ribosomal protein L19e [Candidatus Woesearchaeota archaeon]
MKLTVQKRLAGDLLKCSPKKIRFDPARLEEIKEAITKKDVWRLISEGAISYRKTQETSRSRARVLQHQKSRGQRKGPGSRKGSKFSRVSRKTRWILRMRALRGLLKELKENKKITNETFRDVYTKTSGGYFRSRRHILLYLEEKQLIK